jgi:hypothetical protein
LHLVRAQDLAVAETVLVLQLSLDNDRYDLHVPMSVHAEAGGCFNTVVVNDPKGMKSHMLRVVVFGK